MRKLLFLSALLVSGLTAQAQKNPQIRVCNASGGAFTVVDTPDYQDQVGVCKLGNSIVGSIDLLNKDAQIEVPLSLYNYRKGVKVCSPTNIATLTFSDGKDVAVCFYSDYSFIDLKTLTSGKNSGSNPELDHALSLTPWLLSN